MSYIFLLGQGEESSADNFLDIPACVLSRLNLTAAKSCCKDSETGFSPSSLSGTTSEPLTGSPGEGLSMSSAGAFHARTSASPERVRGSTENGQGYGEKWPESLAKYDPATSSWRTRQLSLFEGLGECLETFPKWGSMRTGELWERTTPADLTDANDYGLWPTVTKELFGAWASGEKLAVGDTHRKSGARIGSIFWWVMIREHLRLGGRRVSGSIPDPSCGEVLMDWPMGWSALQPLETDKYQQWLHSHGGFLASKEADK